MNRFWTFVEKRDGCWAWHGTIDRDGYARLGGIPAHRISYQIHTGHTPTGLDVDHKCRNRSCVNPEHLEAVDHSTNMRRTKGHRFTKKECKNGHQFTEENVYWRPTGERDCRACIRQRVRKYKGKSA